MSPSFRIDAMTAGDWPAVWRDTMLTERRSTRVGVD
jgi:hypothetical protein